MLAIKAIEDPYCRFRHAINCGTTIMAIIVTVGEYYLARVALAQNSIQFHITIPLNIMCGLMSSQLWNLINSSCCGLQVGCPLAKL